LQVALKEPIANTTLLPFARPAFSTARFLTAGPPFFPTVSTGLAAACLASRGVGCAGWCRERKRAGGGQRHRG
jgi:hypothetical protein